MMVPRLVSLRKMFFCRLVGMGFIILKPFKSGRRVSAIEFWIPAFAGMTKEERNDIWKTGQIITMRPPGFRILLNSRKLSEYNFSNSVFIFLISILPRCGPRYGSVMMASTEFGAICFEIRDASELKSLKLKVESLKLD